MLGDRLQGDFRHLRQRVVARYQDAAVPAIAGHHDQIGEQLQRLRCNGEFHRAVRRHLGDLHGRALVHVQGDFRIPLDEGADGGRQRVACLGVSGGQ